MRKIIIHYHRDDKVYDSWGVWLWPQGHAGRWISFTEEDSFGKVAICEVALEHEQIGFVIRGKAWEKDVDLDRYINNFIGDVGEIWLVAGDPQIYLAPPTNLRDDLRVFEELDLIVHYYRYDDDYEGWDLWLWQGDKEGIPLKFSDEDGYGKIARTTFSQITDGGELGFIIRWGNEEDPWQRKDFSRERFVPFYRSDDKGKLEIWLMQDDPKIYYKESDVKTEPYLEQVLLDDLDSIRVYTYLPVSADLDEYWGFTLKKKNEKGADLTIALKEVRYCCPQGWNPRCFLLKTEEPVDLAADYYVEHETHGSSKVQFGQIFSSEPFREKFHYAGLDLGFSYDLSKTVFKVWAPTADIVNVTIYSQDEGGKGKNHPMILGEKGVWACTLEGNLEGLFYNYTVTHGNKTYEVVDPYARSAGVNGERGQIVDLKKTNPRGWKDLKWLKLRNPVDAVIYEVHVRDFSSSSSSGVEARGKYLGLIEEGTKTQDGVVTGLDHLKDLGITHVHLLPVFDFATVDEKDPDSGYNWGYDPLNYNLPEGSYASDPHDGRVRIKELKKLILALNKANIGVIMDVVYNHTFHSIASNLNKLVPGYYYRLHHDGIFSNGSGCGNELADERSMVRKFIVDSVTYWAKEYKISGFRFDLMGLHHLETMQAIRQALDKINPEIMIYGEGWTAGSSTLSEEVRAVKENTSKLRGIASFCNDLRDGVKGNVFQNDLGGFVQGKGFEESVKFGIVGAVKHPEILYNQVVYSGGPWALEPSQSVAYVEAHDNLTIWDKLLATTDLSAQEERIEMMKLAHAIILTSQGIPFIHAGQEFARTKGGDPNSYQSSDQVNQLDWDRKGEFLELYEYTKALIELRKQRPAFRLASGKEVREKLRFLKLPHPNTLGYALCSHAGGDSYETILVFFNSNSHRVAVQISSGPWEVLVNHKHVGEGSAIVEGPQIWLEKRSALVLGRR